MLPVVSRQTPFSFSVFCLATLTALLPGSARADKPAGDKGREHWAFQKLARPALPRLRHADRIRTPADAYLLAKLEEKGMTFSRDADRLTLIRRAFLDLWGLPPAPEQVEAFLADARPDAFEHLLDRLLASPHFGERWGRHWLDVVGYADTVGFDINDNLLIVPEGKWKYRDYVIAAFNRDKPYDRFVTEQLAGDELMDWRTAAQFTPEIRECLIATGYLRTARDESHEPESNIPLIYYGVLHNTVEIVGNSLLGLTLNCARCHTHKFDPIPHKDYYQLMALLTPAYNPKNWKPVYPWKPEIKDRGLPDVSPAEAVEIGRHNAEIDRQLDRLKMQQAELRRSYEARLFEAKLKTVPEPIRADTKAALQTPATKRSEIQKYLAGKFEGTLKPKPEEIDRALSAADREKLVSFGRQVETLSAGRRKYGTIQALYDVGPPPSTHVLKRGEYERLGPEVQPGFLSVLCESAGDSTVHEAKPSGTSSGRRLAFARWLTAADSRAGALLARVMVNRVWQHLFGQGIVATPENFGVTGEPPTHPELLEWLSSEFVRNGWRIKPLIKLIMSSTAYRQSSRQPDAPARGVQVDPGNQLLWRMRLRRLDAEAIRDSILAVSGQLNPAIGGPPALLYAQPDGMVVIDEKKLPTPDAKYKRSVYLLCRRAYNLSLLTVFDQPLVAANCPCRDVSAVPLQSLTMLNDAFVAQQAEQFAERVARLAGASKASAIPAAFRLALARAPSGREIAWCVKLLERQAAIYRSAKLPADQAEKKALVQLCHSLLNTSEFLYAE
ncbi:MAG TPA: DUF1549 and DUF1553 domain-containing protein [Gemmataceae bacterium]|nr:DUF1549 and DUF1553 domain-containing protein [Gemmataceae bacterium]